MRFNIQIFQVKVFTMTTKINVRIHHKHSTINLDINNNDTIDQVKQKICDEINGVTNENGNENGANENGANENANENGTNENGANENGTNENGNENANDNGNENGNENANDNGNENGTNENGDDFIQTDFTENNDNLKINRLRLYPMVNNDIKTGYSFYGISGKDKLLDNHFKTNNYVVFLTL